MADNENEGSNGSFRQNQGSSRKRREPPIIDAKATDVSRTAVTPDPAAPEDPTPVPVDPVPAPVSNETGASDEPVLFGQVLRASTTATSRTEDGAAAPLEAAAPVTPTEPSDTVATPDDMVFSTPVTDHPVAASFGGGSGEPTPDAVAASMPPPPGRSPATMILGVVIAVLLVVIAVLLFTGPPRGASDDLRAALDATNERLTALEARPDSTKLASEVAALDQRTGGFDTDIAALKNSAEDLANRLNAVASGPQAGTEKPPAPDAAAPSTPPVQAADVSALSARLDDVSHKVDALPSQATPPTDLGPLQDKVADLTQRLDTVQTSAASVPDIETRVGELTRRLGAVDQGLAGVAASVAALPKVDLGPLKAGVAAIEQRLTPIEAALSAPKAGDRTTEDRAVGSAEISHAAPLAVVAQGVTRGIEDGRPIAAEVDALRALGVDDATLAPLSGIAQKGAPTLASLKAQWTGLEPDVIAILRPSGGSLIDRFAAGARSIVSVRRVGAPMGEDPISVAGRVAASLDDGDVAAALTAWNTLPEAGQSVSRAWADAARSRIEAQAAAEGLSTHAIEALAKARG